MSDSLLKITQKEVYEGLGLRELTLFLSHLFGELAQVALLSIQVTQISVVTRWSSKAMIAVTFLRQQTAALF